MKYKWEVIFHDECDYWYCARDIYMSLPRVFDEKFKTEEEAQEIADALNKPPSDGKARAMRLDVKEGLSDYFAKIYMSEWGI